MTVSHERHILTGGALSTLAVNMLRTDRDWEASPIDAILYLVIVGRGDDVKARIAKRHGFSADDMATIERIHRDLRPEGEWHMTVTSPKAESIAIDVGTWPAGAKETA